MKLCEHPDFKLSEGDIAESELDSQTPQESVYVQLFNLLCSPQSKFLLPCNNYHYAEVHCLKSEIFSALHPFK